MEPVLIPKYDALMNPVIKALKTLGGSGTIEEITTKVIEMLGLSDSQVAVLHNAETGTRTELEYQLAWTRSYLKKYGVLHNSDRGVWSLTPMGKELEEVDPQAVKQFVRAGWQQAQGIAGPEQLETATEPSWQDLALAALLKIEPAAFERLVQRLLRESGFIQVVVTGRSGDGGIDGKGILRLGGVLSFHVMFQCKRYRGSVTPDQIRDFRGAMVGRADKGLLVTTGSFTKEAIRESTRDGAPAIDLIDGEQLVEKLKELDLGIHTTKVEVEQVTVDEAWFAGI